MGHLGQIVGARRARNVLAQGQRQQRRSAAEGIIPDDVPEAYDRALVIGHLHSYGIRAGNGGLHAYRLRLEDHGDILRKRGKAPGLDARRGAQGKQGDDRAGADAGQFRRNAEILQAFHERRALGFQQSLIRLLRAFLPGGLSQKIKGRQGRTHAFLRCGIVSAAVQKAEQALAFFLGGRFFGFGGRGVGSTFAGGSIRRGGRLTLRTPCCLYVRFKGIVFHALVCGGGSFRRGRFGADLCHGFNINDPLVFFPAQADAEQFQFSGAGFGLARRREKLVTAFAGQRGQFGPGQFFHLIGCGLDTPARERQPGNAEGKLHGRQQSEEPDQSGPHGAENLVAFGVEPCPQQAAAPHVLNPDVPCLGRGEQTGREQQIADPAVPGQDEKAGHQARAHAEKEQGPQIRGKTEDVRKKPREAGTEKSGGIFDRRAAADRLVQRGVFHVIGPQAEKDQQPAENEEKSCQFTDEFLPVHQKSRYGLKLPASGGQVNLTKRRSR